MLTLEIRPHEGGQDAQQFAEQLGQAISKFVKRPLEPNGTGYVIHYV